MNTKNTIILLLAVAIASAAITLASALHGVARQVVLARAEVDTHVSTVETDESFIHEPSITFTDSNNKMVTIDLPRPSNDYTNYKVVIGKELVSVRVDRDNSARCLVIPRQRFISVVDRHSVKKGSGD